MKPTLHSSEHSHPRSSNPAWQALGEMTLSAESSGGEQIHAWLVGLLQPLALQPEYLNRIAIAARDAAVRALRPELQLEHIHLRIFWTQDPLPAGQTWGFFQVEKIENAREAGHSASHAIEFYLYTEGGGN
jgi:hypothetical protein